MDRMGGMVRLVKKVLICVFGAEGIGAVCYAVRFIPQFGLAKGLGYSVFTAVSAFCNAGIDLLGEDSLAQYVADPIVISSSARCESAGIFCTRTVTAVPRVSGPILPRYIVRITIHLPAVFRQGVSPLLSPTVATADVIS